MLLFSNRKFYEDLNGVRGQRRLAWNKVAVRAGVSPTSISKFVGFHENRDTVKDARVGLSLETVVALMQWMNKFDMRRYLVPEDHPDVSDTE